MNIAFVFILTNSTSAADDRRRLVAFYCLAPGCSIWRCTMPSPASTTLISSCAFECGSSIAGTRPCRGSNTNWGEIDIVVLRSQVVGYFKLFSKLSGPSAIVVLVDDNRRAPSKLSPYRSDLAWWRSCVIMRSITSPSSASSCVTMSHPSCDFRFCVKRKWSFGEGRFVTDEELESHNCSHVQCWCA